ncbi:hypothetical protein Salat_0636500 [Sesamum alatum]|uniref:Uncharacterized protein n=1 Tax=Sesamum alatum TaxID=300844 RepID=A0AAE1YRC4_9LAMI|nr:hypothetical protein Salat_0636500 [Sesamum alatum]
MAVAAYASLLSLSHVLDNVQLPARRHRLHLNTQQIQSLQDKVKFLLDFLEVHSQGRSKEIQDLARQIAVVADEVEDVVDFHVVNQLSEGSRDQSHDMDFLSSFYQCIDKVMSKIDSITKELMMIKRNGAQTKNNIQEFLCLSIHQKHFLPVEMKVPWWDLMSN